MPTASEELQQVQTAVQAMMSDNGLSDLPSPVTEPTNDMGAFPDLSRCGINKLYDPIDNAYGPADKDGYLLFQHDKKGDNIDVELVDYFPQRYTQGTYTVDDLGNITQVSYPAP